MVKDSYKCYRAVLPGHGTKKYQQYVKRSSQTRSRNTYKYFNVAVLDYEPRLVCPARTQRTLQS